MVGGISGGPNFSVHNTQPDTPQTDTPQPDTPQPDTHENTVPSGPSSSSLGTGNSSTTFLLALGLFPPVVPDAEDKCDCGKSDCLECNRHAIKGSSDVE